MAKKRKEEITEAVIQEKFSKEQLIKSKTFEEQRDILNVILEEHTKYGLEEVKEKMEEFLKEEEE